MFNQYALKTVQFMIDRLNMIFAIVLIVFSIMDFYANSIVSGLFLLWLAVVFILLWIYRNNKIAYSLVFSIAIAFISLLNGAIVVTSIIADERWTIAAYSVVFIVNSFITHIGFKHYRSLVRKRQEFHDKAADKIKQ